MKRLLDGLAVVGLFVSHVTLAVLGMAMTLAALAVPVGLVATLLHWLLGAGQ